MKETLSQHERAYLAEEGDATELLHSTRNYFCLARPCLTKAQVSANPRKLPPGRAAFGPWPQITSRKLLRRTVHCICIFGYLRLWRSCLLIGFIVSAASVALLRVVDCNCREVATVANTSSYQLQDASTPSAEAQAAASDSWPILGLVEHAGLLARGDDGIVGVATSLLKLLVDVEAGESSDACVTTAVQKLLPEMLRHELPGRL